MILYENIFGLFDYYAYSFPDGDFSSIIYNNQEILITSCSVVILDEVLFHLNDDLFAFFNEIKNHPEYDNNSYPFIDGKIIIKNNFFFSIVHDFDKEKLKTIFKLVDHEYLVNIKLTHKDVDIEPINFINMIRNKEGMSKIKKLYFNEIRKFYDLICVIQSPYINSLEINQIKSDGIYSYFQDENYNEITKVRVYTYDCWMPKLDDLKDKLVNKMTKSEEIPLQELFIARSKVNLRHENYTMALLDAVISLEIVVPKTVNLFLQKKGASKETINDFDHKFGLSVRVKAMLKVILPESTHHIIDKVGQAISLRNKIMHEGLTNDKLDKSINIQELIKSCEQLESLCLQKHEELEKVDE